MEQSNYLHYIKKSITCVQHIRAEVKLCKYALYSIWGSVIITIYGKIYMFWNSKFLSDILSILVIDKIATEALHVHA